MKVRVLLSLVLAAMLLATADARTTKRTAQTVRKEQQANAKKIAGTKKQIKTTLEETRRELGRLQSIEGQIREKSARENLLKQRTDRLKAASAQLADSISATEKRVDRLRDSYGKSLRAMRRQRQNGSNLSFIFSSSSFSQARSRTRYLRELARWENEKAASLKAEVLVLSKQRAALDSATQRLSLSLDTLQAVRRSLQDEKSRAGEIVSSLKKQSANLNKVLAEQQRISAQLDKELNRIIEEEARRAAEEAKKAEEARRRKEKSDSGKTVSKPKPEKPVVKPADNKVTHGDFAKAKGRLSSPVDRKATVVGTFGRHSHEEYSKVEIQNNGLDFEAEAGANACSVFPGTVSMVIVMEGYRNVVLIRHGEYLTVYAGLETLNVRKGQQVEAGTVLGRMVTEQSDSSKSRLHFEIRHEKQKLNPAEWLR